MTYGKRLAQAMASAKKSRKQLADRLGCTPQIIGMVITGAGKAERKLSTDNHTAAAEFLGVNAKWLADGDDPMLPTDGTVETTLPSTQTSEQNHPVALASTSQVAINDAPTLSQTLTDLGNKLMQADPATRDAVADLMSRYTKDPASGHAFARAIDLLVSASIASARDSPTKRPKPEPWHDDRRAA